MYGRELFFGSGQVSKQFCLCFFLHPIVPVQCGDPFLWGRIVPVHVGDPMNLMVTMVYAPAASHALQVKQGEEAMNGPRPSKTESPRVLKLPVARRSFVDDRWSERVIDAAKASSGYCVRVCVCVWI